MLPGRGRTLARLTFRAAEVVACQIEMLEDRIEALRGRRPGLAHRVAGSRRARP
ncbi:hypothetical protein [Nonomuraea endophytica]|uniref:Uncharacterized protein n=1 Tax=Nonomuraea endophytica TaxID=714136 RepID=A0A7W8ACI3_9ACTN|nr:hypothetical protein [Nonomuraea endophytica]MBB5083593.1 hypothetical protein [Nonomuraea endophytica]